MIERGTNICVQCNLSITQTKKLISRNTVLISFIAILLHAQCSVSLDFLKKWMKPALTFPSIIPCNQGFFHCPKYMYTVNSGRNYAHVAFLPSLFPSFIPGLFFASYLCHHQYSAIYIPSHVCVGGALRCVAPCIVCRSRRNKDLVNNKKESLRDQ